MKPIFKTIGNYTKEKRLEAGLSQASIARKLGYGSAQFISNVERGLCNYPAKNLKKLEKLIKIDLSYTHQLMVEAYDEELSKVFFPKKKKEKTPSATA